MFLTILQNIRYLVRQVFLSGEVDSNYIQLLATSSSFGYTQTFIMDEQNKAQV